jgi:hypothetical protein
MTFFGLGEILGAGFMGKMVDKVTAKNAVFVNIVAVMI